MNNKDGVQIDLVFTVDPIRKPLKGHFVDRIDKLNLLEFTKGPNITTWRNYYQTFDSGSLGGASLKGNPVQNADLNEKMEIAKFHPQWKQLGDENLTNAAHIFMPSLTPITSDITKQIKELPAWRDDWRFNNKPK